jgi:hypothetical protein
MDKLPDIYVVNYRAHLIMFYWPNECYAGLGSQRENMNIRMLRAAAWRTEEDNTKIDPKNKSF